jgi:hypothetical protein
MQAMTREIIRLGFLPLTVAAIPIAAHGGAQRRIPGFLSFDAPQSTLPEPAHAAWFYAQMVRWGQAGFSKQNIERVMKCYRPEIYAETTGAQYRRRK